MAAVRIVEYTDPGCPWAYSAEPVRRRIDWLYGGEVDWEIRTVVLAESPAEYHERGFTPERQAAAFATIAREHGMPIDTSRRSRMGATGALLRCLRVHFFAGDGLLDEPEMLQLAADSAGVSRDALAQWMADPRLQDAVAQDMAAARRPLPAARVLDHKLANWSGGVRYTCPSYEITRLADGVTIAVPGFQPFAVYDVLLANLVPGTERRAPADDAAEVLRWAGTPLATREVAVLLDTDQLDARERLGRVATERHVGADGFWTLAGVP
jgi:2-hydroxychromene-2-carboxylate isomerase